MAVLSSFSSLLPTQAQPSGVGYEMGYTENVNVEPPGEFLYSLGGMDCHCERSEAISGDCGACSERNEESPSLLRLRLATVITPRNDNNLQWRSL
jgi:hypothetical protein